MYKKVNITENTLQVLSLFTNDFSSEYYIREVERLLKISPRTAQLILEDLEGKGIVESKTRGKIKTYRLRFNDSTSRYLVFTENYKAIAFFKKNLLVKEIIEKLRPSIKGIGLIFGSYAKGTNMKESDLDIFVAGDYDKKEVKRISDTFGIEVSIKCYPLKIFEKNVNKDILLKEILKNHIAFTNCEKFVDIVVKN